MLSCIMLYTIYIYIMFNRKHLGSSMWRKQLLAAKAQKSLVAISVALSSGPWHRSASLFEAVQER